MKSFSLFIAAILFLALSISNVSCIKEYSEEGKTIVGIAGGTAVYTMAVSDGNCASPVINGSYTTGNGLQAANTILLQVNVTTIGTYVLSTNITNGIQFSTGGNFTTTGLQTIKLTGSGIPVSPGAFTYSTPVGVGCTFFITFS